jgi:RNA polymerase sigma-70 factor (ECF subfamily)
MHPNMQLWDYIIEAAAADSGGRGSGDEEPPDEGDDEERHLRKARVTPERFDYFYLTYNREIYRFAYFKTLDHHIAEDIMQQTFLTAQEKLWRFHWQGLPFRHWLVTIALGLVRKHFRREKRQRAFMERVTRQPIVQGPDALQDMLMEEKREKLLRCMRRLPEEDQNIIFLRDICEFRFKAVAKMLKTKEETVKSRRKRSLKKLERMLRDGDQPPFEPEG